MIKKWFVIALLIVIIIQNSVLTGFAYAPSVDRECETAVSKAVEYLHSVQNDDGGFPMQHGMDSSVVMTSWAIMALATAGEDVTSKTWTQNGKTPVVFLKQNEEEIDRSVDYARVLLALSASDSDLICKGENMLDKILSIQQSNGAFYRPQWGEKGMIYAHMWSILAIASTGESIPNKSKAKAYLLAQQNEDGGFAWFEDDVSDTGDTAVAIQTLVILGENHKTSKAIQNAFGYLKEMQKEDGGFCAGEYMGTESTSASDAWVLQAFLAAGKNPLADEWKVNGKDALHHLLDNQATDGSFDWKKGIPSSTVKMTSSAIIALKQKPHPVAIDHTDYLQNNMEQFNDLSSSNWAYDEVMDLVNDEIISGYPDGSFKPEKLVTRAEFTRFLVYGLDKQNLKYTSGLTFKDVPRSHWAYSLIRIGVNQKFISGRSMHDFDPNGKISGAELACMLIRSMYKDFATRVTKGAYWYSGYVDLAKEQDLLYPGFDPSAQVTREQCTYSIYQLREELRLK